MEPFTTYRVRRVDPWGRDGGAPYLIELQTLGSLLVVQMRTWDPLRASLCLQALKQQRCVVARSHEVRSLNGNLYLRLDRVELVEGVA